MLATTCYDKPDPGYVFAMACAREAMRGAGIQTAYCLLPGNCHVDDARNEVVRAFLYSDCTDLVFIDADVIWTPPDLVRLCQHDADVVGAVYPYRRESDDALPVRLLQGDPRPENGLVEVEGLPTGFLRIRRHVLEKIAKDSPSWPSPAGDVPLVFERVLIKGTRWGGDLNFCNRWRAMGGRVLADYEMTLGHAARVVVRDSLGSLLRRRAGVTVRHVVEKIRAGTDQISDLSEAIRAVGNKWGAAEDVLASCVALARRADGPIIETGSGLSTVLMAAAAPGQIVYCLEHSPAYAESLKEMARDAGVGNIGLCLCPILNGWYDLTDMEIPRHYALGLNDGPPRKFNSRRRAFHAFNADVWVVDDADDLLYRAQAKAFANSRGMAMDFVGDRAAILSRKQEAA